MGSSPEAILAYGFDLGVISSLFEWHYDGDVESGGPPWFDTHRDSDFATGARLALLAAKGVDLDQYDGMTMVEQDEAGRAVGVKLVRHGSDDGDETLILATSIIQTDWNDVMPIHLDELVVPVDAEERLTWALDVLGISRPAPMPTWLLAAYYG